MADAFGYGRRSDDDQSAFSPDAQKRAFYDWCAANGHRPVQWYFDDDLSGKRDDRVSVQRQLDRLRAAYFAGDEAITDAMYRSESARLKALLAESSPQLARQLNHEKARAMMQTIGTVLDTAPGQERRWCSSYSIGCGWSGEKSPPSVRPARMWRWWRRRRG